MAASLRPRMPWITALAVLLVLGTNLLLLDLAVNKIYRQFLLGQSEASLIQFVAMTLVPFVAIGKEYQAIVRRSYRHAKFISRAGFIAGIIFGLLVVYLATLTSLRLKGSRTDLLLAVGFVLSFWVVGFGHRSWCKALLAAGYLNQARQP